MIGYSAEDILASDEELQITSETMVYDQNKGFVEFTGSVVATRGDAEIFADQITVYIRAKEDREKGGTQDTANQNIEKIVAQGNVRYLSGDQEAYADTAVYTADDQVLTLTGKAPRVVTGDSFVTGSKITVHRQTNIVTAESGGSSRVEVLFNPKDRVTDKGN